MPIQYIKVHDNVVMSVYTPMISISFEPA
jgi:hypothetical protein